MITRSGRRLARCMVSGSTWTYLSKTGARFRRRRLRTLHDKDISRWRVGCVSSTPLLKQEMSCPLSNNVHAAADHNSSLPPHRSEQLLMIVKRRAGLKFVLAEFSERSTKENLSSSEMVGLNI